jgi:hypothetical protein
VQLKEHLQNSAHTGDSKLRVEHIQDMFKLQQKLLDAIKESTTRLHQRLWLNTNVPGSVEHISILMAGPSAHPQSEHGLVGFSSGFQGF